MTEALEALPPLARTPPEVLCARDYETLAGQFIAAPLRAYIAGGSEQELTLRANLDAFAATRIVPRLLRDVSAGHTRVRLLGRTLRHPVLLAPLAFHGLVHPRAERETARGAEAMEACMVASTLSSCLLEEIAASGAGEKWFQLYFQPGRDATLDLVRRAERAGFAALVLTLDAAVQSPGLRARRAGFRLPEDLRAVNLQHHARPPSAALTRDQSRILQGMMREAPTRDDLAWLLTQTRLPVIVKGVLHAEDACMLQSMGVAGLVVSNHGGRALDGAPASLSRLPRIRKAVGKELTLLVDGGVRSGTDVFKAIALGADAVMIGRLQLYALAVAGALGVGHLIKLLREELELCMALAGCPTLADIVHASIEPPPEWQSGC